MSPCHRACASCTRRSMCSPSRVDCAGTKVSSSSRRAPTEMRVAMLAPISWRTPPRAYGPWELLTSLLTEGLVARGIDVTLFATLDSQTAGKLAGVVPRAYSEDPTIDAKVWEA